MTLADLAGYSAKHREPVCSTYRAYEICSMGPPSSGGIAVESALGILENFDLASLKPSPIDRDGGHPTAAGVHLIVEAERLAYADRDKYVADTDFVPLPGGSANGLLDKTYLRSRAQLIAVDRSMGRAQAGAFGPVPLGIDSTQEHGTTQLTIGDRYGNVVTMTTTVESGFGSFHFVRGFALNNQLTDFSFNPADANGTPIANRVAGGKRPRSAMAPTLVFARSADGGHGDFVLATGSAGGFVIIQYVVKSLVGALDWGLDPQQAVSLIDFGAANSPTTYVGGEHPDVDASDGGAHDPLVTALRAMGHTVSVAPHSSGLTMLRRVTIGGKPAWSGGADPRREGAAVGDVTGR
jgi:gamma-glutamyltranspeptidase/glutathione hydrolase